MKTMRCLLLAGSVLLLALAPGCGGSEETEHTPPPPAPRTSPNDRGAVQPGTPAIPPAPVQPGAPGAVTEPAPGR